MLDNFRFETFVDVHSNIFNEYLSSVIAKLSKENEEYQALQDAIESLYRKYPAVLGVCDSEQAAELTKEDCAALIQVMELKNQLKKKKCLSPAKKYKVYKSSINKSLHFEQRRLSSSTRG